jgi:release factor glutamine methyltransferase
LPVRVLRSDLLDAVSGEAFDVIVANPPYVCSDGLTCARQPDHVWDGGPGGRAVLDRLCAAAPSLLTPGGMLLLVQSAVCGIESTIERLRAEGLKVTVGTRRREPFGPIMTARATQLEDRGLISPKQRYEDLVVIRAEQGR